MCTHDIYGRAAAAALAGSKKSRSQPKPVTLSGQLGTNREWMDDGARREGEGHQEVGGAAEEIRSLSSSSHRVQVSSSVVAMGVFSGWDGMGRCCPFQGAIRPSIHLAIGRERERELEKH